MLHSRAYFFLVMVCPLAALLGAASFAIFFPGQMLWGLLGLAAIFTTTLYLLRPDLSRGPSLRFVRAFQEAPAGLLLLDLEGRVEWLNRTMEEIIEQPLETLVGQPLSSLLTGEAWDTLQTERRRLLDGERVDLEGHLKTAKGKNIWTRAYANLLRNDLDKPEFMIVQILDLSAEHNATSAASQSELRLFQTLDLATDLVINTDHNGRITYANKKATKILDSTDLTLEGQSILDYIATEDRTEFVRAFKACQDTSAAQVELPRVRMLRGGRNAPLPDIRLVSANMMGLDGSRDNIALVCRDTHDQLASLEQLRSSEARFSRIFHSSPDAILILRQEDTLILDFNASFTRLLGYSREDAIGCLEVDLNLFCDNRERARIAKELDGSNEATDLEIRLKTKSGDLVTVEISLRYIEIDGDLCLLCIGRDITKRMTAEAALRSSEEKFEQVFTRSPDGIIILRQLDLAIFDINESFLHASGYTRDELVGRSAYELNVFARENALENATEELTRSGYFQNREMAFRTKDGHTVECLLSATFIEIDNEPCVLCIAKNVNELRQAEEKLKQSEQRFRGAFENSPVGIVLIDLEGNVFQANHFVLEVLGYEESLENVHISRLIPTDDRAQFKETLAKMIDGKEQTVRTERRMLRADNLEIWTNFHIVVQRDSDGQPLYLIGQIADITEMKSSQSRMERMAFYDTLTNLANRRLFYDRLGQAVDHAQRSKHLSALLYLDLDQFKRVNDTLGHEVGDILLQEVSMRLTACVRKEDTVARLGGDEFTVLLFDIRSPSDASLVADKILKALRQPLNISGHQLVVTTSIGITIVPQDGTEPNSLMKNADLAMYRAKEHGRNIYQFYSEEMNTNAIKRLRTEYELRRAMERNEFILYYQPKVRLSDQQVVGVECLIRWDHPDRGILAPIEFIEVAEETGAIVDMGTWIIKEACQTGKVLCEQAKRNIQIAINISPRQFKDPNLVATIRRNLRETGLNPATLEIEITETMLMGDVDAANQTVRQLHDLGVRLAIDDFGTGYSSLNYLKKFPINTVKVDRSFVMDIPDSPDDMAITSAVIAMAHRLNMEVVAEGVETREQFEFLIEHDCEYAQGYLFSKPLPLDNIRHMIQPNLRVMRN